METQPYVLAELEDFSPLSSPLKSSQRIKFTCFDASQNFIVIGATSGGIYVFQRIPCVFLQLIPNTEGAITQVSVSPNESIFAFSTIKGVVFLIDHNVGQLSGGGVRKVQVSSDHRGAEVTAFQWNELSNDLYIGDDKGKISVASVSFFMAKTIFQAPSFTLMELDSKIVQLDLHNNFLLVSTLTRSYICDTVQEQYRKIGSRPRDGAFGACFQRPNSSSPQGETNSDTENPSNNYLEASESENARIFCARPGARLWEVGIGGDVVSTHKLGEALVIPAKPIITMHSKQPPEDNSFIPGFSKVFPIGDRFLFTYERQSVYIVDPEMAQIILWSRLANKEEITDARTIGNVAYLWSGSVIALTLLTVEECLNCLYSAGRFQDCVDLSMQHIKYLMSHAQSIQPLADLRKHLMTIPEEMVMLLEEVAHLSKKAEGRNHLGFRSVRKLESGIHVIGDGHHAVINHKGIRETRSNVRSRSASPGSSLRKFGSRSSSKDAIKKKNGPLGVGGLVSIISTEAASSSSLPDLMEPPNEGKLSFSNNVANKSEKMKEQLTPNNNQSEAAKASKNSMETLSFKFAENKLKEKWQELEDRVRSIGWDFSSEAVDESGIDVGNSEAFGQNMVFYEDEVVIQSRNRLLQKNIPVPKTKPLYPVLDLEPMFELSRNISANEMPEEKLISSFFDSIFSVVDSFVSKQQKESEVEMESVDEKKDSPIPLETTQNAPPFPFSYYFPNSVIAVVLNLFDVLLCSKNSTNWLDERFVAAENVETGIHPALKKCYTQRQIQDDINFCAFVDVFAELVDPQRIMCCLGEKNTPCRYLLWQKMAELLIEKPRGKDNSGKGNHCASIFPPALPWILSEFKRVGQINCSKLLREAPALLLKENIPMRHCLYIILWICANDNSRDWCSTLLSVLVSSGDECQDNVIQTCALDAFMELNRNLSSQVLCNCGFLRAGAFGHSSPRFASIGVRLARHIWCLGNDDECLKLCWNTGLWRWLVWFLHAGHKRRKESGESTSLDLLSPLVWHEGCKWWKFGILHLLATLADKWSVEEWLREMDEESWRRFLDLRMKVTNDVCLGCEAIGMHLGKRRDAEKLDSDISWTEIGILMIEYLGAEVSCRLLMESGVLGGAGQLDASFYKLCLLSTVTSTMFNDAPGSELSTKSLLKRMTTEKVVFSPRVAGLIEGSMVRDCSSWQTVNGDAIVPLPPKQPSISNHHWGCTVSLGKNIHCPRCSLPIASQVLLSGKPGGLLVLPCGHALHTVCTRSSTSHCPLGCPRQESECIE